MDQPLKSALANVFSSPRLEAVHLRRLVLESPCHLLSLFSEAPALKEMSLSRLYFTQAEHEPWPESQLWCPKLRSLVLNLSSTDFCQYLVNPQIDLTHVRTLKLATHSPEQRKKMVLAMSLRRSRGVEHLNLWLGYDFSTDISDCKYLPHLIHPRLTKISVVSPDLFTTNLCSIHFFSLLIVELLVVFVETCPHDSRLEYVTLDGFPDYQRTEPVPELHTAIDATVAHLPALKTIEMRWIVGEPSAARTQWETDVHAAFSSLMGRGILRITKLQCMCTEFLVLEPLLIDVSS
jgi:hypothetical protein